MAQGLSQLNLPRGSRCLIFLRPSLSFSAVVFALFKIGLVPVFIDPGMKREYLWKAIGKTRPEVLIAEPVVRWLRFFFPRVFRSVRHFITPAMLEKTLLADGPPLLVTPEENETAAILYTSGGTGEPKGVVYTHAIFQSQTRQLQQLFNLAPGQTDLPGFPLFSLFALSLGMKSAIPALDPRRPARACPAKLYQNIRDQQANFVAGSPAIWKRLGDYCKREGLVLPSVRSLVMFGAPVAGSLHQLLAPLLPNGETYSAYGATECLPVAVVSGRALKEGKRGIHLGVHLGAPAPGVQIKILPIGEIAVHSESVTPAYADNRKASEQAKFRDEEGRLWHRMGDLGHLDEEGHLWMEGRKSHLVKCEEKTFSSVPCEAVFNRHPRVERSALIAHSSGPAMVVQARAAPGLGAELLELAKNNAHTREIQTFFCHSNFPVDTRHNIKIDRLLLAKWAERGKLGRPLS